MSIARSTTDVQAGLPRRASAPLLLDQIAVFVAEVVQGLD